ncbi:hypothetical protein H112_06659 [Trichophyton rubrum D6]|nr:hypothetical protein H112_06659 [Trichophyton rubrum D6]
MMFGLAKRKLESTHLWRIAKRMPKGTLLHCHLGAMVEVDWLFERILAVEGMHVCSSEALDTEAARVRAVVLFKYHSQARFEPRLYLVVRIPARYIRTCRRSS